MSCVTSIDWPGTGAMLQGIGTLLGAGAVLIAALIGQNTFNSWKQQKLSEARRDQAERILTAVYKVRRHLESVRSPGMFGSETDKARKQLEGSEVWADTHTEDDRKRLATAQAYYNRINAAGDDRKALDACLPMARAFFGQEIEGALEKLNRQFWSVQVYVDANCRDRGGADEAFRNKIDQTIYTGIPSEAENEIDQIVIKVVNDVEAACVPALRMETGPLAAKPAT